MAQKGEHSDDQSQADLSKPKILTAKDAMAIVPPPVGPDENKLQYSYSFWFSHKQKGSSSNNSYEEMIKHIGAFSSVQQFWAYYCHMARPSQLPSPSDIHLFKCGIKPLWEDDANKDGGKWIIRLKKGISPRCWEYLILAIIGEQFFVGNEICGAVISIRPYEDIISVWNRISSDRTLTDKIRDTMTRVMTLPVNTVIEYKAHNQSLKDKSSYRNTDVFFR